MKTDLFTTTLDVLLQDISELGNRVDRLAKIIYGLIEGDDPEEAAAALHEFGYTDEDGFWIGDDEE